MKLFFSLSLIFLVLFSARAEKSTDDKAAPVQLYLEKLARFELSQVRFKKTKIGGSSGAFFLKDKLYVLSDDRGKINEPRYYVFSVHFSNKNSELQVQLEPEKVVFIKPSKDEKSRYLDGEAFVALDEKRFLVSCEGDNNHKPRRSPRLFEIDAEGNYLKDWTLPDELRPEPLGLQKKGILNNSGIEGLSLSSDGQSVLAAVERPLLQENDQEKRFVHFYEFAKAESSSPHQDYIYPLSENGFMTGVSEVLSLEEKKYFVLERGISPQIGNAIFYMTSLSLVDLNDVEIENKKKILRKSLLNAELGSENFEAMAWGPSWAKYDRTLWILNDNNFSKSEKNVFLVFGVSKKNLEKKKQ